MTNAKPFLKQTAQSALFAFREYFRPFVLVAYFLKSRLGSSKPTAKAPERRQESS